MKFILSHPCSWVTFKNTYEIMECVIKISREKFNFVKNKNIIFLKLKRTIEIYMFLKLINVVIFHHVFNGLFSFTFSFKDFILILGNFTPNCTYRADTFAFIHPTLVLAKLV